MQRLSLQLRDKKETPCSGQIHSEGVARQKLAAFYSGKIRETLTRFGLGGIPVEETISIRGPRDYKNQLVMGLNGIGA